jgi:tetratricopeptide (TPR) repeat protein
MSVELLVAQAAEAEANLDLPKALNTYEEALKLVPEALDIALRLAVLAFRLSMWPMAEKFYAHLITHGIHDMPIISGYAASLREQSKYDEAVDVLKTVLGQRPEEAILWEGLGAVMAAKGDGANALTFFNEALRLQPDNLHARFNRACTLIDQGEKAAGLEELAVCADAFDDPDNHASAQIAYAQALLMSGDLENGWRTYDSRERYGTALQVH